MVSRSCLLGALAALRPYMANKGRMKTDMSTASQLRFIIRKSGEMIIVAKNTELDISKWARVECRYSKISLGSGEHKDIAQNTLSLIMPIRHVGEHIEEIQNEIRRFTLDINYLETLLLHEAGDTVTILYKDRCSPFALYFN
jgi:translation initiation factor 2B subunit (eIF-2B alpha/beta/delta family)